uniref:FABP domain-containing protein n=1 Tax=Steinernema glaseri TaxID=37863 RepID=A0A1I7YSI4_9BILA
MKLPILCLLALACVASAYKELPEKFLGKFSLTGSENFDEYLAAKGVAWFVRRMIVMTHITKCFEAEDTPGLYRMQVQSSKMSVDYRDVVLGETFEDVGLD